MDIICYDKSSYIGYTVPEDQLIKTKEHYPVSLLEAKRHLRIENDFVDDNDYIVSLIKSATMLAENYINGDIAYTHNELTMNNFDTDRIKIYEPNFNKFVNAFDTDDNPIGTVEITKKHYEYFTVEWKQRIKHNPITLKYYTGYDEDETPELIKSAILIKVADLYDNNRSSWVYTGIMDSKVFETILNFYVTKRV